MERHIVVSVDKRAQRKVKYRNKGSRIERGKVKQTVRETGIYAKTERERRRDTKKGRMNDK
jgi:hypothetical protein